jgi:anti-sigma regulatory factor (Ser/Thr protein kinase)
MHTVQIVNVASHDMDRFGTERDAARDGETCFGHELFLHRGADEFLAGTMPFIADALERDEPLLVAVAPARCELIGGELGADAARVAFVDMHQLGRNPARIIPAWRRFLDKHQMQGRAPRGIGEPIWPGRREAELDECARHERLVNVAFGGGPPWRLMCTYDLDALRAPELLAVQHSHPFTSVGAERRANAAFLAACDAYAGELSAPPADRRELRFETGALVEVRKAVAGWTSATRLAPDRVSDLVVAVNELASNSVRHAGGSGTLRMWVQNGTATCEISDGGCITSPLAGRVEPGPGQLGGRGLWMANQVCDLVQIRSAPDIGTTVRAHMHMQ